MGTGRCIPASVLVFVFLVSSLIVSGCTTTSAPPRNITTTSMVLVSDAFPPGGIIPARYTCDGQGESPPITWETVPDGTRSFALVLEDPDVPGGTYTHWIVYNIPGETREIPAGITTGSEIPGGGMQGINSIRKNGYTGPCPFPQGSNHHYVLTLFALDTRLDLSGTVDAATLRNAMQGHILGTGQLAATYKKG
jgi:Raf kinase inhibitor-like YbhB/YbcL family protein